MNAPPELWAQELPSELTGTVETEGGSKMPRLLGSLLLAALVVVAPVDAAQSVRVLQRADVYTQPTGSAPVMAVALGGQLLDVVVRQGDWYQVRVPSTAQVGHIYALFVEPVIPGQPAVVAGQGTAPAPAPGAIVQAAPISYVQPQPMAVAAQPLVITQLPFSLGSPIPLGPVTEGPVALRTARFRMERGLLQAEVYATCDEGEDQEVSVTLQLMDEVGTLVATLNMHGGVEEEDDATLKARASIPAQTLARVRSFALQASTRPD